MRREGSPWTGVGAVFRRELSDNLSSVRMRFLEVLVVLTGTAAVYAAIGEIRNLVAEDRFVFLRIFTVAREPLPSFITFLAFLIPIVAIALAFDSVNGEFNRRTISRILAQPIYRDALLFGKFLAGLATLGVFLTALWLFLMGLGILLLGVPPSGEEILRGLGFLLAAIAYGGVWLALAMLFSIVFRAPATAALAALSCWLLFAVFWGMIVPLATEVIAPVDPFDPRSQIAAINTAAGLNRLSPNALFAESTLALLNPGTRSLGPVFASQLHGALVGAPLPVGQSFLLIWPQLTGLIAAAVLLFTIGYVLFQRQEIRA
jgi:ABC-2 type transport system permease protein